MAQIRINRSHLSKKGSSRVQSARDVDIQHMTSKELSSYIRNEGKRLNQQIVELEKRGKQRASYAYERLTSKPAYAPFLGVTSSGHTKINLNQRGMTRQQKQQLAKVIEKFSGAKTITVSGIEEYNKNVLNGLRRKYPGLKDLSDDELSDILKTEGFAHIKGTVGSDTIFKLIAKAQSPETMIKYLESSGAIETRMKALEEYNTINKEADKGWRRVPLNFNFANL